MISVTLVTSGALSQNTRRFIENAPVGVVIRVLKAPETLAGNEVRHVIVDEWKP